MWNHLVTTDQRKSGKFYGNLLGWSHREMNAGPFGIYTLFACDGEDVAGMMNPTIDYTRSRSSSWYAHIAVRDVDDCASRVGTLGGKVIEVPHEVPGVGRACLIADPMGAAVTLMTPAQRP